MHVLWGTSCLLTFVPLVYFRSSIVFRSLGNFLHFKDINYCLCMSRSWVLQLILFSIDTYSSSPRIVPHLFYFKSLALNTFQKVNNDISLTLTVDILDQECQFSPVHCSIVLLHKYLSIYLSIYPINFDFFCIILFSKVLLINFYGNLGFISYVALLCWKVQI